MPSADPRLLTTLLKPFAILRKELIIMLYRALFPYIAQDFRHKIDCQDAHAALGTGIQTHTHISSAPGTPNAIPIFISPDQEILSVSIAPATLLIPDPSLIAIRTPVGLPPDEYELNQPFSIT